MERNYFLDQALEEKDIYSSLPCYKNNTCQV